MKGIGTIVNVLLIIAGGAAGLGLRKLLPKRLTDTIMQGLGLAVIIVGLNGVFSSMLTVTDGEISSRYTLLMILSLAIGSLIGEFVGIEAKLESFAQFCGEMLTKDNKASSFAQGFVTATLVYCVGAMAIVGSLEDGINGNADVLFAKSVIDGISAMVFSSAMGIGVLFSAVSVGIYQGLITLLAVFIAPNITAEVIAQISLIGSILIMAIGFNMLKITKIKVGNLLPAILAPIVCFVVGMFI